MTTLYNPHTLMTSEYTVSLSFNIREWCINSNKDINYVRRNFEQLSTIGNSRFAQYPNVINPDLPLTDITFEQLYSDNDFENISTSNRAFNIAHRVLENCFKKYTTLFNLNTTRNMIKNATNNNN